MKKIGASLLVCALIGALLLQVADLLDVHCDSDEDCARPMVCRLVCRRNCKSVCVLLMQEKPDGEVVDGGISEKRKKHRMPAHSSAEDDEEQPFDADEIFSGVSQLLSTSKSREQGSSEITPLTISEAELEAELRQLIDKEEQQSGDGQGADGTKAPPGFVTAPLDPQRKATTAEPLSAIVSPATKSRPPLHHSVAVKQRERPLTLSTDVQLLSEEEGTTVVKTTTTPSTTTKTSTTTTRRTTTTVQTTTTTAPAERRTTTMLVGTPTSQPGISPEPPEMALTPTRMSGGNKKGENYSGEERGKAKAEKWAIHRLRPTRVNKKVAPAQLERRGMERTTVRVPVHWYTSTQRTTLRRCAPPPVCGRNCGVGIDADGCQSCQCLWLSKHCSSDTDCASAEGQFCELDRCQCMSGWEQDPTRSGVCRRDGQRTEKRAAPVQRSPGHSLFSSPPPPVLVSGRSRGPLSGPRLFVVPPHRLNKREDGELRPNSEARLHWPGPCDSDDQCPASLYCVEGDCWTLEPEKANRQRNPQKFGREKDATTTTPPPNSIRLFPAPTTIVPSLSVPQAPIVAVNDPRHLLFPLDEASNTATSGGSGGQEEQLYDESGDAVYTEDGQQEPQGHPPSVSSASLHPDRRLAFVPSPLVGHNSNRAVLLKSARIGDRFNALMSPLSRAHHRIMSPPSSSSAAPLVDLPSLGAPLPLPQAQTEPMTTTHLPLPPLPQSATEQGPKPPTATPIELRQVGRKTDSDATDAQLLLVSASPVMQTTSPSPSAPVPPPPDGRKARQRRIFLDYSRRNRIRRPVRVEMVNSRELVRDECSQSRDCGRHSMCCVKRWCDLGGECGVARFCLPDCELTKLAHLSELAPDRVPRMDLVYD